MSTPIDQLRAAIVPFDEWEAEHAPSEPAPAPVVVEGDFRERIKMPGDGQDPRDFLIAMGKLAARNGFYFRAGQAWFYDVRQKMLQPVNSTGFCGRILDFCMLEQFAVNKGRDVSVMMSGELAGRVIASPQFLMELPEIARVSQVPLPVLRKGKLRLLSDGYDAETKTLVIEKLKLSEMSVEDAVAGLRSRWLGEFPLKDKEKDFAVLVTGMLTPFCELLVPAFATRPAFVFTCNREGGGKTLAARLCLCPVHGKVEITPPPERKNDAELKKLLGSVAAAGKSYILFDNWKGDVESGALEGFITSNVWSDRTLGKSELFTAEKSCLVYVTGNSAKVSPDMRRRSLFVHLFVEDVRTESRHITRRIDEEDILTDRAELLSYLWSMVKHWHAQGMPKTSVDHGSFGKWGHVVGAIVEAATGSCPLVQAADDGDDVLSAFERLLDFVMEGNDQDEARIEPGVLLDEARELGGFDRIGEDKPSEPSELRSERMWFGALCKRFVGSKFAKWRFDATTGARQHRRYIITRVV